MAGEFLGGLLGGGAGSIIGGSVVRLFLDDTQFNKSLASAQAKNKTASGTMAGGWSKFGMIASAAAVTAGVALVKFAATAIAAARDEYEAVNKVNVVFGKSAEIIQKFAETSALAFGISKTAALEAAGTFGNLILKAGITGDAAADMSVSLVKLASDLASFNNIDPTEALEKLRSGLVGQPRPLRTVGVLLSETRVEAEAYASGIVKVGQKLTDGQKIQARYNLILKDTKNQQGDFARTSDGLANQQRILAAQFEDLQAEAGQKLLPAMMSLIKVGNELIPVIAPLLVTAFEQLAEVANGVATGVQLLQGDLSALKDTNLGLLSNLLSLNPATKSFGDAVGYLGERQEQQTAKEKAIQDAYDKGIPLLADIRHANEAYGTTVEATGKKVRHFADMTKDEMTKWKDSLRDNFEVADDVFERLADKAKVTADQIINSFIRQINAQNNYADNWDTLNGRKFPDELRQQLADMGMEGASIVDALAGANDKKFNQIIAKWRIAEGGADRLVNSVLGIKNAIDRLPVVKKIDIELNVRGNMGGGGTGTQLSGSQVAHLIDQMSRHP